MKRLQGPKHCMNCDRVKDRLYLMDSLEDMLICSDCITKIINEILMMRMT